MVKLYFAVDLSLVLLLGFVNVRVNGAGLGRQESLEMVQRYTGSVRFEDSLRFYEVPLVAPAPRIFLLPGRL